MSVLNIPWNEFQGKLPSHYILLEVQLKSCPKQKTPLFIFNGEGTYPREVSRQKLGQRSGRKPVVILYWWRIDDVWWSVGEQFCGKALWRSFYSTQGGRSQMKANQLIISKVNMHRAWHVWELQNDLVTKSAQLRNRIRSSSWGSVG